MARFQPLPRKATTIVILTLVALCIMAVESTGSKKVPQCCSAPARAARAIAAGIAPPGALVPAVAAEPNRFMPIAPADAEAINDERPLANRPLQPSSPTYLPTAWDAVARQTARQCLATAIYYEAAGEGWHGELGVAQVVLNRVRHPAYPKTICGVVYQGSNLPTGCQFTFTCDGRLGRPPSPAGWKQAEAVADAALAGAVEPRVGMSTHYHTRAVVPYWAPSLDKLAVLGNHIFYTFAGTAGNRRAFSGRILPDAALPGANLLQADARPVDPTAASALGTATPPAAEPPSPIKADARAIARLAADERGSLAPRGGTLLQSDSIGASLRSDDGARLR